VESVLSLVLADAALELVPREIWRKPAVVSDSRRRGVEPGRILLDRSLHHSAMLGLPDAERRGRPDLVHSALLSATGTPLFIERRIRVYVHTRTDVVLKIEDGTRIPKNYLNFRGLAEKLLWERNGEGLVGVSEGSLTHLITGVIKPDFVVGLSTEGKETSFDGLARKIAGTDEPCVVVGGYPRGHFSGEELALFDELARIDARPLESHVVIARLAYEVERALKTTND